MYRVINLCSDLSPFNFFLLLLQKLGWNPPYVFHCTGEKLPQFGYEGPCILAIEKPCEIDLHLLAIGKLH